MSENQLSIEIVYALPDAQTLIETAVEPGTTVETAIKGSGILQQYPDIDLDSNAVGIWYRTCKLTDVVNQGDRIEIYRPLIADPKEARRRRAEKAKLEGRADKVTGGRKKR